MTGAEFIQRVRGRFTTVKDRKKDIGPGLLRAMLVQLGVSEEDITV